MKKGKSNVPGAVIVFFVFVAIPILLGIYLSIFNTKYQHLRELNYTLTLNDDGSMDVVEVWDIQVSHTNTLFRTFEKNEVTNVSVKDLTSGYEFLPSYKYAYHVQDGYYYALFVEGGDFEIAWGTGLENTISHKTYEIRYTVKDVVNSYLDCDEIYWKLLSSSNGIPARKVTGKIILPKSVKNTNNLYVWGHGPLNGEIQKASNNTVEFNLEFMDYGRMLEVRVVTAEKMFENVSNLKTFNHDTLSKIKSEEKSFASTIDLSAQTTLFWYNAFKLSMLAIIIFNIIVIIKYYIKSKSDQKVPEMLSKYFREIPGGNNSTPGEAAYLYFYKEEFDKKNESSMVAGTILDLATRKQIKLDCENGNVYVTITGNGSELKSDELSIFKLLKSCAGSDKRFEISKLKSYAKKEFFKYSDAINNFVNKARDSLYKQNFVDKANENIIRKAKDSKLRTGFVKWTIIILLVILGLCFVPYVEDWLIEWWGIAYVSNYLIFLGYVIPYFLTVYLKNKLLFKMDGKIAAITQSGFEMQNKWIGLVNYMKDFSLIDEKTVPDLILWEKYLVFATTFGISKQVIEQMKAKYPKVFIEEKWEDENLNVIKFFNDSGYFSSNIETATSLSSISKSISEARSISTTEIVRYNASHSSSSGGGGGGFSGGGGGRWRRWPEWEEDNNFLLALTCTLNAI